MASDAKTRANRRNAKRSTGPKTPAGKEVARRNAVKHGILAEQTAVLPGEDPAALRGLVERLRQALAPVGELEELLVDQIAACVWRSARIERVEAGLFTYLIAAEQATAAQVEARMYVRTKGGVLEVLANQGDELWGRPVIDDEQAHRISLERAADATGQRDGVFAAFGRAFLEDVRGADAFSRLARYETALDRRLFRRLHELQRLQAARKGHDVPPLASIDISTS